LLLLLAPDADEFDTPNLFELLTGDNELGSLLGES
jgi:hypothetical protein